MVTASVAVDLTGSPYPAADTEYADFDAGLGLQSDTGVKSTDRTRPSEYLGFVDDPNEAGGGHAVAASTSFAGSMSVVRENPTAESLGFVFSAFVSVEGYMETTAVPEPSTCTLIALGPLAVSARTLRRSAAGSSPVHR